MILDNALIEPLLKVQRLGVVSDFDGTLSQIVPVPADAQLTVRNRTALQKLTNLISLVALISGRSANDLHQRAGLEGVVYVGNHGMERWTNNRLEFPDEIMQFRQGLEAIEQAVTGWNIPGVRVEDKQLTLSIHYRQTQNPDSTAQNLQPTLANLAQHHGLKLFSGRMVFEIRPPVNIHKGTALYDLVTQYRLEGVIFLGDDTTDADALKVAHQMRADNICYAVGVGVDSEGTPPIVRETADLLVSGVEGVEIFLEGLVSAVSASSN